jgi:hypothetical protein
MRRGRARGVGARPVYTRPFPCGRSSGSRRCNKARQVRLGKIKIEGRNAGSKPLTAPHRARKLFRDLWAYFRPQRKKLRPGHAFGAAFDFAVTRNERKAERGESGAATLLAADLPLDGRDRADAVDFIRQGPRAPIGHAHHPARSRDGAATLNIFEQLDFAGSDPPLR